MQGFIKKQGKSTAMNNQKRMEQFKNEPQW